MKGLSKYGKRLDGTDKGTGWFGELPMLNGNNSVMTELSSTFNYGGKDVLVPLINPYTTREELFGLALGNPPSKELLDKTANWGFERLSNGQSPFITKQEQAQGLDKFYRGNM